MAVAQQFCRAGGADDAGAYDDNVVGHASGCALLEIDAALQDLEREGVIGDAQTLGACKAPKSDLPRRGLPGALVGALPAPMAPGEDARVFVGVERGTAVVAERGEEARGGGTLTRIAARSGLSRKTGEAKKVAGSTAHAALATARRAMTPIRWARYSELAWMSLFSPLAGVVIFAIASGEKFDDSACSISR